MFSLIKTLLEAAMPKMEFPGVKVTMLHAWEDRMEKAIEKLGYDIVESGYADGSTAWAVAFEIPKTFDLKKFENQLRAELNFNGWMKVQYFDLVEPDDLDEALLTRTTAHQFVGKLTKTDEFKLLVERAPKYAHALVDAWDQDAKLYQRTKGKADFDSLADKMLTKKSISNNDPDVVFDTQMQKALDGLKMLFDASFPSIYVNKAEKGPWAGERMARRMNEESGWSKLGDLTAKDIDELFAKEYGGKGNKIHFVKFVNLLSTKKPQKRDPYATGFSIAKLDAEYLIITNDSDSDPEPWLVNRVTVAHEMTVGFKMLDHTPMPEAQFDSLDKAIEYVKKTAKKETNIYGSSSR